MSDEDIISKIENIIEQLRPNIQMDGGDVEFLRFQDGIVYIRFQGACIHCPVSSYTLKMGIEENLKNSISDVLEVVAVDE
jgi:Fe-S cluster biogenesis protein NfuA